MFDYECYECGLPVALPDRTFYWACTKCGFTQHPRIAEQRLRLRFAKDGILWNVLDALLDRSDARFADTLEREEAIVEGIAKHLDAIEARIERARSTFRRPAFGALERVLAVVEDSEDGETAWRRLLEDKVLPASFANEGARFFSEGEERTSFPREIETCIVLASDVPGVLEAERHFVEFAKALGLAQPVLWDDGGCANEYDVVAFDELREDLSRHFGRELRDAPDVVSVSVGAELYPATPNPFAILEGLMATGHGVTGYETEDGRLELWLVPGPRAS